MGRLFGARLREQRERAGLSQSRLALISGATQQEISSAELGDSASDNLLAKLAPMLGLEVSVLRAWKVMDDLREAAIKRVADALGGSEQAKNAAKVLADSPESAAGQHAMAALIAKVGREEAARLIGAWDEQELKAGALALAEALRMAFGENEARRPEACKKAPVTPIAFVGWWERKRRV